MMDTSLLMCGYSYHAQPFTVSHTSGLEHYLFRLQTEGLSTVHCRGETIRVQAGDLLLLRPGDDYALHVGSGENGRISSGDYYLSCQGPWIDAWWRRTVRPAVSRIGIDDRLLGLWRSLILEKRRGPGGADSELAGYLLQSLCLVLDRSITETLQTTDRSAFLALRLRRYIEEHATATFRLEDAAGHAGVSLSRAVHLFKAVYGTTMIQYATEVRLHAAIERMRYSTMALGHIAETCGFASYSYFHRVFSGKYGMSPAKFRAQQTPG